MKTFAAQVTDFVAQTQQRIRAVVQKSTQDVIDDAQMPKAKGGRMPIDTGFLRNSGTISYSGLPVGPSRGTGPQAGENDVSAQLGAWNGLTDIWFGWTAEYAVVQEVKNGYLRVAAARWPEFVMTNSRALEARVNARRR